MSKEKIGKRIQEYREKASISQETLADEIGVSATSISNIERGKHYPTFENFIRIANVLGTSADALLSDVIDATYPSKASELTEKLERTPLDKRLQILAFVDVLIDLENNSLKRN